MDIKLLKSRRIILSMLQRRGYNTDQYKNYSINEIRLMRSNDNLDMLLKKEPGMNCYVRYYIGETHKKFKSSDLQKAVYKYFEDENDKVLQENDELIIITDDKLLLSKKYSNFIGKLENYYAHNYFVQIFNISSLLYDVTKHSLVPEHSILSNLEKEALLKHFNIDETKLPCISRFDPVAKFIGLRPGDVCKIKRSSYTSGDIYYYRLCH